MKGREVQSFLPVDDAFKYNYYSVRIYVHVRFGVYI